jgi:hypothetical protein
MLNWNNSYCVDDTAVGYSFDSVIDYLEMNSLDDESYDLDFDYWYGFYISS